MYSRDLEQATAFFEESLTTSQKLGYKGSMAISLNNLGAIDAERGEYSSARLKVEQGLIVLYELRDQKAIAGCLENLAKISTALRQTQKAVRLLGAAAALRDTISAPLRPVDRSDVERDVADARAALGEEAFAAAWAQGRAMTLEQAVEYALQNNRD